MVYVAELFTSGLPPSELVKRSKRVREAKKGPVCKGTGCLTRISAYNRDENGKPEKLCYMCQSKEDKPVNISQTGTAHPITCKKGHDLEEGGLTKGRCRQCQREYDQERWAREAETKRKSPYPRKSYLNLHALKNLMEAHGMKPFTLAKEVGIPHRSLRGYALDCGGCPPDRAMKLADYFGVSVEELCSRDREVA